MHPRTVVLTAAAAASVVPAPAALAQATVVVTAIDQTWRVPAGDPTYDPSQWFAVEVELQASGPYTLTGVNVVWTLAQGRVFHLPSAGIVRPTPEQIAANPVLRYSTFMDISPAPLSSLLPFGYVHDAEINAGVVLTPSPQSLTLQPGQRARIARLVYSSDASWVGPSRPMFLIGRPSGEVETFFFSGPLAPYGSVRISETGDQYDNDMTLRVTLYSNEFVQTGAFLPAARIEAVPGQYPGWVVRKDYVDGVHGVSITPLHTLGPTETLDIHVRTRTAQRDLRYAHAPFRFDFGWWSPVAGPPIAGDADDDGRVAFSDLNIVLAHFGEIQQTPYRQQGDLSGNGIVDLEDLNIVLSNFGAVEPG